MEASLKPKRKKISIFPIFYYLIFTIITLIVVLPILIVIFASFKTSTQLGIDFPLKPPTSLFLDNYKDVFENGHIFIGLRNILILVGMTLVVNSLISTMVAYTMSRFEFRFKKVIIAAFMVAMMVPTTITEIARFGVINNLGLYNTIFAPLIIYAGADLTQLYIYMQYMKQIPKSIDESAMIDGCSYIGIYWKIIFPIIIPATVTLAILKAVTVMNDMYVPYLYMPSRNLRTLTTTLMAYSNAQTGSVSNLSAAVIITMIPTVLIFLFLQKFIFKGIVAGAIKE
ncbi:MAG: carbohydrate ABC transporter permease [Clostridiaceae bacterium]